MERRREGHGWVSGRVARRWLYGDVIASLTRYGKDQLDVLYYALYKFLDDEAVPSSFAAYLKCCWLQYFKAHRPSAN